MSHRSSNAGGAGVGGGSAGASPSAAVNAGVKGKVIVIGEYSVGKTSLTRRFVDKTFTGLTEPTIGAAFQVRTVVLPPHNTAVTLQIFDTAGSERYRSLMPMYYRDARAAIICYDITNAKTFERVSSWVHDFKKNNDVEEEVLCVLAGTKADLEANRQVDTEDAQAFAEREKMVAFETSARSDTNVMELFTAVAQHIYRTREVKRAPNGAAGSPDAPANPHLGPRAGNRKGRIDLRDDFSYRNSQQQKKSNCKC